MTEIKDFQSTSEQLSLKLTEFAQEHGIPAADIMGSYIRHSTRPIMLGRDLGETLEYIRELTWPDILLGVGLKLRSLPEKDSGPVREAALEAFRKAKEILEEMPSTSIREDKKADLALATFLS